EKGEEEEKEEEEEKGEEEGEEEEEEEEEEEKEENLHLVHDLLIRDAEDIDELVYEETKKSEKMRKMREKKRKKKEKKKKTTKKRNHDEEGGFGAWTRPTKKKTSPCKDALVLRNKSTGNVMYMCGWCGITKGTKTQLGGHVNCHRNEVDYPNMPRPKKVWIDVVMTDGSYEELV
ncbi:hypothetical protein TrRE_jg13625, partial [Triparma retinervis]